MSSYVVTYAHLVTGIVVEQRGGGGCLTGVAGLFVMLG